MPDLLVMLLTFAPWIELRGSIPLGIAAGLDPLLVLITAFILNTILFFPLWLCLSVLYERTKHWRIVRGVTRNALKRRAAVERWGIPGLAIFVAIPAPFTGVWTATILAWLLRMPAHRAFAAIAIGVLVAAAIVFAATMGVLGGLGWV